MGADARAIAPMAPMPEYTGLAPMPFSPPPGPRRRQQTQQQQTPSLDAGAGAGTSSSSSAATASTTPTTCTLSSPHHQPPPTTTTSSSSLSPSSPSSPVRSPPNSPRPGSASIGGTSLLSKTRSSLSAAGTRARLSSRTAAEALIQQQTSDNSEAAASRPATARTRSTSEASIGLAGAGLVPFEPFVSSRRKPRLPPLEAPTAAAAAAIATTGGLDAPTRTKEPREAKNATMYPDTDGGKQTRQMTPGSSSFSRTESISSTSVTTAQSTRTVTSTDPSAAGEGRGAAARQYTQRNGRTYMTDAAAAPYPLPVDLPELHRQSLRTLLLMQVHGAPVSSPSVVAKPPLRVLEVGCGTGFWSMMCHRFFKGRGHAGVSFTGLDIAPLGGPAAGDDMKWSYVQHDIRNLPWPFADGEFDLVFWKDMSLVVTSAMQAVYIEESVRLLRTGGTLEIWETDHTIRMLRPHVPNPSAIGSQAGEHDKAASLGAYVININTPLSAPLNTYLVEYNGWVTRALKARDLMANPCTMINHQLLAESESLAGFGSHRVAVPLSEVRWEREGVGGVITKDGKSYVDMSRHQPASASSASSASPKKTLTAGQAALRRTALVTLVDSIQALEPFLRDASGKSQDEWDLWLGKMMADIVSEGGTNWGECLESGAWWGKKK